MYYINADNKIMTYKFAGSIEIINNTGYEPLCCRGNIILMTNDKLYCVVNCLHRNIKVLKIITAPVDDYVCNSDDFTDSFVKINSPEEYYEIRGTVLKKIPIIAKNSHNIISVRYHNSSNTGYYYIAMDNNLMYYNQSDGVCKILDNNVDSILLYKKKYYQGNYIIYYKNNTVICSECCDAQQIVSSHAIDYSGSSVIKTFDNLVLDSDGCLYKFIFDTSVSAVIKKISSDVKNFNQWEFILLVTDSENNMYEINYQGEVIGNVGDNCYFERRRCNIKSANKTYKLCD